MVKVYFVNNGMVFAEKCLKWRTLPFSVKNIGRELSPYWTCSMNTDLAHNK